MARLTETERWMIVHGLAEPPARPLPTVEVALTRLMAKINRLPSERDRDILRQLIAVRQELDQGAVRQLVRELRGLAKRATRLADRLEDG
jgi:hypothetical protein